MKIAIINNLYPPLSRGGAEVVAESQANKLSSDGHDIFIITTKPIGYDEKEKNIYRFFPLNIFSFYNLNKYPFPLRVIWRLIDIFNIHSYIKVRSILTKERPDIVYVHNLTGLGYLIPRLIKKSNTKYIQTIHDVALVRPSGLLMVAKEKESLLIKLYFKITRFLYGSPDEVVFPSEWLKKYYSTHTFFKESKLKVVRNYSLPTDDLLTNKKNKSKKVNIVFAGQIEMHKGILDLIEQLNNINTNNYTLNILGTGSILGKAKRLASDNESIIFHGYQKIDTYLAAADYTIVPSLCYENSPTIIFESLSAKVPVIASDLGGTSELLTSGKNGYLYNPASKENFEKVLKKYILNTDDQKS
jgi:glycosyltransferase involved in cell wall biosynthesis